MRKQLAVLAALVVTSLFSTGAFAAAPMMSKTKAPAATATVRQQPTQRRSYSYEPSMNNAPAVRVFRSRASATPRYLLPKSNPHRYDT